MEQFQDNSALPQPTQSPTKAQTGVRRPSMQPVRVQETHKDHTISSFERARLATQIFLNTNVVSVFMTTITIFILFSTDIRVLSTNAQGDPVFYGINTSIFALFGIEFLLNCFSLPDYILSFNFFLDLISTGSIILDIGWITQSLFPSNIGNGATAQQIQTAQQGSQVAQKIGSIFRIIRLVRLIKLFKHLQKQVDKDLVLKKMQEEIENSQSENEMQSSEQIDLKKVQPAEKQKSNIRVPEIPTDEKNGLNQDVNIEQYQTNQNPKSLNVESERQQQPMYQLIGLEEQKEQNEQNVQVSQEKVSKEQSRSSIINQDIQVNKQSSINKSKTVEKKKVNVDEKKESKLGEKLSNLTSQRVFTVIMGILISVPIFDIATYTDYNTSMEMGINRIVQFQNNPYLSNIILNQYIVFHNNLPLPLNHLSIPILNDEYNNPNIGYYQTQRKEDLAYYGVENSYAVVFIQTSTNLDSILSICRTIFVSIVLGTAFIFFSKDIQILVLDPVDRMIQKVERISNNPLEAAQIEEQEALIMQKLEEQGEMDELAKIKEAATMETGILEGLLIKIGALLAVGFGEAGAEIIASNMKKGGEVDPMLPGRRVLAIFGFCDIRNFTDATEVLQQGVMVFVNEIAEIVHGTVDTFLGSANKNIGDAFLLVWKYNEENVDTDPNTGQLTVKTDRQTLQKADLAVVAFLKIMCFINLSKKLKKYKENPGLNERLPNYSVKMGFGLHQGWAIEGAIGSNFKVDASYLSPNVNMASRLEAATKQFGSSILISGNLRNVMTPETQKHLRHIDRVTVKGSVEPVDIYCVDVSFKNLSDKITKIYDKFDAKSLPKMLRKKFKFMHRVKKSNYAKDIKNGKIEVSQIFQKDPEMVALREIFTQEFYDLWEIGFQDYLNGNWGKAYQIFEKTYEMLGEHKDGPSNTLLSVIREEGGKAPPNFKGFRELTEK